jgi:hypothetical protein
MSVTLQVPRNNETCVGPNDKKWFLIFRKGKGFVMNIGKLLQIGLKVLEIRHCIFKLRI